MAVAMVTSVVRLKRSGQARRGRNGEKRSAGSKNSQHLDLAEFCVVGAADTRSGWRRNTHLFAVRAASSPVAYEAASVAFPAGAVMFCAETARATKGRAREKRMAGEIRVVVRNRE